MENEICLRYATKEDATLVADLSRQTFYDAFAAFNTKDDMDKFMNEQFTREKLMAEVSAERNIFFLAFDEQKVVGYAKMRESVNPNQLRDFNALEIARIYATNQSIGKGVGSALMQRCLDYAVTMKKEVIWLGVWENNQRAIDFYIKWGFEKFGEHEFVLGNDVQKDLLMKKILHI